LITKKYWALVWGETTKDGSIEISLIHDRGNRTKMTPLANSQRTKRSPRSWTGTTRFRRRGSARGFSLLEVEITRGVTHQIRAHLEASGHPIVGDPVYGAGRSDPFALGRQFLHACYLAFRHPKDGRTVEVKSALPPELLEVLEKAGIKPGSE
jgi:23S rRNA pseudouridine1911/1915/1917 synthase